ncbi:hypothetical protein BpHYR1_022641 [Brachionus plicatilis]|uniref:Uncharacterized protein n=1 Tax=Brachionus plicatilis TaxID=10195 RepID=A0A3M7QFI4_BRAPC|nr:hypothetical protein BpHYR1_022641 [Brachionus plicatilis]
MYLIKKLISLQPLLTSKFINLLKFKKLTSKKKQLQWGFDNIKLNNKQIKCTDIFFVLIRPDKSKILNSSYHLTNKMH